MSLQNFGGISASSGLFSIYLAKNIYCVAKRSELGFETIDIWSNLFKLTDMMLGSHSFRNGDNIGFIVVRRVAGCILNAVVCCVIQNIVIVLVSIHEQYGNIEVLEGKLLCKQR